MWALRVLSGASAGKIYNLKGGKNLLGRAAHCDIQISSNGISKEHCEIHVFPDKIMVVDLKSSNGTLLNGVRIQNATLRLGDKVAAHDVIFDLVPASTAQSSKALAPVRAAQAPQVAQAYQQPQQTETEEPASPPAPQYRNVFEQASAQTQDFMETVLLPGIYKLPEWLEFRWVLGGFVIIFIFAVTVLSMIPSFRSAKESGIGESMRRAQSVARHLAEVNQKAILEGSFGSLSTHSAELEEGIKDVYIVQKTDGMILAPASRAGRTPDDPFVHKARREDSPISMELNGDTIGASAPIGQFDPATGLPSVKAYAIVIYDVSSMAMDQGRAVTLFLQILILASVLGGVLFYFLAKLVEKPVRELNTQLDNAMRERRDNIQIPYLYPAFQALIGNVNSLLSRSLSADGISGGQSLSVDRHLEAQNLVSILNVPGIVIGSDEIVWTLNEQFARMANWAGVGTNYRSIPDSSLQQNIEKLIQRSQELPLSTHSDTLDFSGRLYKLQITAFMGSDVVDYFFITISPGDES